MKYATARPWLRSAEARRRWRRLREAVLQRDRGTCYRCGDQATAVHHIQHVSAGGDPWDAQNCISICEPCHRRVHSRGNQEWRALLDRLLP